MERSGLAVLAVAVVACIPCLAIPIAAVLLSTGALGAILGPLGVPWVIAVVVAVLVGGLAVVWQVRRRIRASCEVPAGGRRWRDA